MRPLAVDDLVTVLVAALMDEVLPPPARFGFQDLRWAR